MVPVSIAKQMKAAPGPPAIQHRVGLRAVAAAAGVSLMTVSLALRNSPLLRRETTKRVQAVADRLGYRPDPEISRLMSRLRPSRKTARCEAIALLDLWPQAAPQQLSYHMAVRASIHARAARLGFAVDMVALRSYRWEAARALRVIRSRGITGVLLLPSAEPIDLGKAADWNGLSVVSATTSVISPRFHQVGPSHLHNIRLVLEEYQKRGYTRIGAILNQSLNLRTQETYAIALAWKGHGERVLMLPHLEADAEGEARVEQWLRQHDPEVILGGDAMITLLRRPALARRCAGREIVSLTNHEGGTIAFLDQRPASIGECAVSLLTGMMHNHETGVPAEPQVTMIPGTLQQKRSYPLP